MSLNKKHYVVILPTLMDDAPAMRLFTGFWPLFGLTPVVLKFGWKEIKDDIGLAQNIAKIISEVDHLAKLGTVSLVGCSAGGNIMINIFSQRKDIVHRVINVCGALRPGGIGSKFDTPAYLSSLRHCEEAIAGLNEGNKKKIMTIRPRFGDEFVRPEQVNIEGARNINLPTFEHMLTIMTALTIFSQPVISFLKNNEV
jgi:hypothetical protein